MFKKILLWVVLGLLTASIIGTIFLYCFNAKFKNRVNKVFKPKTEQSVESSSENSSSIENIEKLKVELEKKTQELELKKSELESTLKENEEVVNGLKSEVKDLEKQLVEKSSALSSAVSDLEIKNAEFSKLFEEKETIESELEVTEDEKLALENQLVEVNILLESANADVDSLTELKASLETQVSEKEVEVETLTEELETANNSLSLKDTEIATLTTNVEVLISEKTDLETQVLEKQTTIDDLTDYVAELGSKINDLENKIVNDYALYNDVISSDTAYYTYMLPNGNMILSNRGILMYDFYNGQLSKIVNDTKSYTHFVFDEDLNKLLCLSTTSQYIYDIGTTFSTNIGSESLSTIIDSVLFENGNVLLNTNYTSGHLLVDMNTNTMSVVSDMYCSQYKTFIKGYYDDLVFISYSATASYSGLWCYDNTTQKVTRLCDAGNTYAYEQFKTTTNHLILSSGASSNVVLFDYETKTAKLFSSFSTYGANEFFETSTGHVIVANSAQSSEGRLYVIDLVNKSMFKYSASGNLYDTFVVDENGVKITSSVASDPGATAMYFDYETKAITNYSA